MNQHSIVSKYVLGQMSEADFRENYLDKRPLLLPNASSLHEAVNVEWVDEYLAGVDGDLHSFVRVITDFKDEVIQATPGFSAETQKTFLEKKFQSGSTLVINDLDERNPTVAKLSRALERTFGGQIAANAFLTPHKKSGFEVHFDPTSAFVVQLAGEKLWKIYERVELFPTQQMLRKTTAKESEDPILEVVLRAGDVLYLPGGYPHAPTCLDKHSLHVTLAIEAWRAIDVIAHKLNTLSHLHPQLRRPLYLGDEQMNDFLVSAINTLCENIEPRDATAMSDCFQIAFNSNRPDANSHGFQLSIDAENIGPATIVARVNNKPSSVRRGINSVTIFPASATRPGRPLRMSPVRVDLPIFAAEEVEAILSSDTPRRICDIPGALDVQSKVTLVRRLMLLGLVHASNGAAQHSPTAQFADRVEEVL